MDVVWNINFCVPDLQSNSFRMLKNWYVKNILLFFVEVYCSRLKTSKELNTINVSREFSNVWIKWPIPENFLCYDCAYFRLQIVQNVEPPST